MAADEKIVYMNARDERGWPICHACDKPISPDDDIARSRPYLASLGAGLGYWPVSRPD
jgi:hypothetical protein